MHIIKTVSVAVALLVAGPMVSANATPVHTTSLVSNSATKSHVKESAIKQSSMSQRQALASAKSYLSFSAFSSKGLFKQLKFEGFSTKDALYAVTHVKANWNIQAYKSAKSYLSSSSFSKKSLYSQLIFEGFTPSQAAYGVNRAYR
jgi:hypothetical protein